MYYVGDVVLHGNNVCVVLTDGGESVAVNDGTTRTVSPSSLTLLYGYKDMLKDFERSILACNPVVT